MQDLQHWANRCNALFITRKEVLGQRFESARRLSLFGLDKRNFLRNARYYHFCRARSWGELVAAADRFVEQYNTQMHWTHRERKDARRSPSEVLGFLTGVRPRPENLERTCFSTRFTRVLDSSGYACLKH
jgi:hypothetical protein